MMRDTSLGSKPTRWGDNHPWSAANRHLRRAGHTPTSVLRAATGYVRKDDVAKRDARRLPKGESDAD